MKIKKIISMCTKRKCFCLHDQHIQREHITQWIGDGFTMYPLEGFPLMNEDSLCAMFDITEKSSEKISFYHEDLPDTICLEDTVAEEQPIDKLDSSIMLDGEIFIPYFCENRPFLVKKEYLLPLEDMQDYLQMYERKTDTGTSYMVAKVGLLLKAVIIPENIIDGKLLEEMKRLNFWCKQAIQGIGRKQTGENSDIENENQTTMFEPDIGKEGCS